MRINEQIAALRKQKGVTQGELAQALGVTNQSVSKWESGQCCPDIQLLPEIAKYFEVSIDELMGKECVKTNNKAEYEPKFANNINDPLFADAVELLGTNLLLSTSVLQRKMGIGYLKAKELIDLMLAQGYIVEVKHGFYKAIRSQQDYLKSLAKSVASKRREDVVNTAAVNVKLWT